MYREMSTLSSHTETQKRHINSNDELWVKVKPVPSYVEIQTDIVHNAPMFAS